MVNEPLPEDVQAALQDAHDRAIGLEIAHLEHRQSAIDNLHEAVPAPAETAQYFVKRGAVFKRINATRLRPGEQYFAKRAGGWEYASVINANGEPPEQEIIP